MKRRTFLSSLSTLAAAGAGMGLSSPAGAAVPGLTNSRITLGSTLSISGILAGRSADVMLGMNAAFGAVNKTGGVNGRELKLMALDDGYAPARSVENVNRLLGPDGAFALLSCTGTSNNAAIIPLIEHAGVPYVGPLSGADSLRLPTSNHVFHLKAGYADEVNRLIQQLGAMGLQDVGVAYLDNDFGKEIAKRIATRLEASKRKAVATAPVSVDGSNAAHTVEQLLAAKPSVVVLATTGSVSATVIRALRTQSRLLPIAGLSISVAPSDFDALGSALQGLALTQVFPDATSPTHGSARAYQAAMRASGHDQFNSNSFEGYINAMVLAEGIRRAGRDATRDSLRAALAGMNKYDVGEFELSFGNDTPYVGSHFVGMGVLGASGRFIG